MSDLISRSALLEHIDNCIAECKIGAWRPVLTAIRGYVLDAPAVDVKDMIEYHIDENARTVGYRVVDESQAVPVVHGRWEFEVTKEFGCRYHNFAVKAKCSECGKERPVWYGAFPHLDDEKAELAALVNAAVQKQPKFCEECGAKMDGGDADV